MAERALAGPGPFFGKRVEMINYALKYYLRQKFSKNSQFFMKRSFGPRGPGPRAVPSRAEGHGPYLILRNFLANFYGNRFPCFIMLFRAEFMGF